MRKGSLLSWIAWSSLLATVCPALGADFQTPPTVMSYDIGGNEAGKSVKTDSQGNIYVGVTSNTGNGQILKYSASGQLQWVQDYDANNPLPAPKSPYVTTEGLGAITVQGNSIYAVGTSNNGTTLDCLLKKYDASGNLAWERRFAEQPASPNQNDHFCRDLAVDSAGNIAAGGTRLTFSGTSVSSWANELIKWDASGNLLGSATSCGAASPCMVQIQKVAADNAGNILTIEQSRTELGYRIAKYDSSLQRVSITPNFAGHTLAALATNVSDYVVVSGSETVDSVQHHKLLVLYPTLEQYCMDRRLYAPAGSPDHTSDDLYSAVTVTADGRIFAAGSENKDFLVMGYDMQCNPKWLDAAGAPAPLTWNGDYRDHSSAVTVDSQNNLIVAGDSHALTADMMLPSNATILKFPSVPLPDFVVTAISGPTTVSTGQQISFTGKVKNLGQVAGGPLFVSVYLSTDSVITPDDIPIGFSGFGSIAPGEELSFTASGTVTEAVTGGTYYIGAFADSSKHVLEGNETNNGLAGNQIAVTVVAPDLTVISATGPATATTEDTITVTSVVKNLSGMTRNFTVDSYLSRFPYLPISGMYLGDPWLRLYPRLYPEIGPGKEQTISERYRIPWDLESGTYYISSYVDEWAKISETNENNNALIGTPIVITRLRPDFVVTAVSGPATGTANQTISMTGTMKNQGPGTSEYSWLGFYLSTDPVISTSDTLIGYAGAGNLAPGTDYTFTIAGNIPSSLLSGTYYVGAIADATSSVIETNETNNALTGNTVVITNPYPDLTLTATSGPASANLGQQITVTGTVKNQGQPGAAAASTVGLYLSTDATITTADTSLGTVAIGALAAGAQQSFSTSVTIPVNIAAGTYYIGTLADVAGVVTEGNESNNTGSSPITVTNLPPDFIVTAVSGPTSGYTTGTINVSATVKNQGGLGAGAKVRWYLSTDATITTADTALGDVAINPLNPGAQQTVSGTFSVPAPAAGTYYIGAIADYDSKVAESNEANNAAAGNTIVLTQGLPDLIVTTVSGPTSATKGQQVTVTGTVKNQGQGSSGPFFFSLYLSTDATISSSDTAIGSNGFGNIAAGDQQSFTLTVTIPATLTAGTYYIGAVTDSSSYVAEINETNNATAGNQITIQ